MKQSKAQLVFRPAVAVAGLSVLGVIILSALHEVSAPGVIAREAISTPAQTAPAKPTGPAAEGTAQTDSANTDGVASNSTETDGPAEGETRVAQADTEPATAQGESKPFGDIVMGDPDAPVTVIEYSSMTCPHCARFHTNTLPALKEQYIDTGKVNYIMREFPLDNLAAAASMLARCMPEDKFYPFVDMLYEKQAEWANSDDPLSELRQISKVAGFTEERFNSCLSDQQALDYIQQVRDTGNQQYDIRSTPTLIINGQKLEGNQSIDQLQAVIDPMLEDAGKS
jgi:protein-disulfide isomerase